MKLRLFAALFAALTGLHANEDFILQEAVINGNQVSYKIPVSGNQGEVVSHPVDSESSVFRLITVYTDSENKLKTLELDTKTVGTFVPSARIAIFSNDPHPTTRTRFDQAYHVQVTLENLSANPADPLHAREVTVVRSYKLYNPETHTTYPDDPGKDYAVRFPLTENKTYNLSDGNPAGGILPRLDILENEDSHMMGEEIYTVYAAGTNQVLASARIKIWPLATAEILGIEDGVSYSNVPLQTSVKYRNLYPGCAAYVQVRIGDEDVIINSSAVSYDANASEPQTQQLPLHELDQLISEDGVYLLKAYTITPFNNGAPEQLYFVPLEVKTPANPGDGGNNPDPDPSEETPIEIKRTIRVNGTVNSME